MGASVCQPKSANWATAYYGRHQTPRHWMNSEDARAPVAACNVLLDRGYGMPQQMLEVTHPDDFDHASDAELNKHILEQMIEILCDPEILSRWSQGLPASE